MIPIKVPTPALLSAAPHLATLAILDAALFTAEEVLLANHPDLHDIDAVLNGERAPPEGSLIPILVAHFDELRHLWHATHPSVPAAAQTRLRHESVCVSSRVGRGERRRKRPNASRAKSVKAPSAPRPFVWLTLQPEL